LILKTESYESATRRAALFEADWLGVLRLTGADRVTWLQGMVTADIGKLNPGEGVYAAHLNAQGKLLAQMTVLRDADALWLVVEQSAMDGLVQSFEKLLNMEDVLAENVSSDYSVLAIVGPEGAAALQRFLGLDPGLGGLYSHRVFDGCRVASGLLGFELLVPKARAAAVVGRLAACGAASAEREVWDVLRTEAGLPVYGVDVDETTTMPELGERGISYDKGCYIGQEVVARVKYIGHVNRRFVGFLIEGEVVPAPRTVLRSGGRDVGYLTTALMSPGTRTPRSCKKRSNPSAC
jgi:folate-binding protein YgfZ